MTRSNAPKPAVSTSRPTAMAGLLSHVAMSVGRSQFTRTFVADLELYETLFGWQVDRNLSIDNERLLISLPGHGQYLNVRAADSAMLTTSYEHIGIYVESAEAVRDAFERVRAHRQKDDRVELDERGVQVLYGGVLTTFRFRYLLPLAVEVQHLAADRAAAADG